MVQQQCERRGMRAAETAALASSVGGGVASLTTQSVIVPVDVVSHLVARLKRQFILTVSATFASLRHLQVRHLQVISIGMQHQ